MALQGSLADVTFPDLIQLVSVSGKTGVFNISGEEAEGKIYLKDGQITDATVGKLRGEYAVYEMAMWSKGRFIFTPNVLSDQVTVTKSNTSLMMEAARRLDEWRVLQRKIPSMELIPYFRPRDPSHDQITLSPHEWMVVTKVDGEKSIGDLEAAVGLPAYDVCKVLYGLVTSGLVALRSADEKPKQGKPAGPSRHTLLALVENVRKVAADIVSLAGIVAVDKQCRRAVEALDAGQGMQALQALVDNLARTISLLEGGDKAGEFLRRVTPLVSSESSKT